jgi:hypothetical protein
MEKDAIGRSRLRKLGSGEDPVGRCVLESLGVLRVLGGLGDFWNETTGAAGTGVFFCLFGALFVGGVGEGLDSADTAMLAYDPGFTLGERALLGPVGVILFN